MANTINIDKLTPEVASILSGPDKPVFLQRDGEQVGVVVSPDTYREQREIVSLP